jgi:hypothetical protein
VLVGEVKDLYRRHYNDDHADYVIFAIPKKELEVSGILRSGKGATKETVRLNCHPGRGKSNMQLFLKYKYRASALVEYVALLESQFALPQPSSPLD